MEMYKSVKNASFRSRKSRDHDSGYQTLDKFELIFFDINRY